MNTELFLKILALKTVKSLLLTKQYKSGLHDDKLEKSYIDDVIIECKAEYMTYRELAELIDSEKFDTRYKYYRKIAFSMDNDFYYLNGLLWVTNKLDEFEKEMKK